MKIPRLSYFLLLPVTWLSATTGHSQNTIGLPAVTNYSSQSFHAGIQTRRIDEDRNGVLFFANSEGLLTFNGNYWNLFPLPNKTIVRSVASDSSGKIYVGGQDELGYFYPDARGSLQYHSLRSLVPSHEKGFGELWEISFYGDEVFFQSSGTIFQLKDNAIRAYDAPQEWRLLTVAGGRLFAEDKVRGLLVFKEDLWQPVCGAKNTATLGIVAITGYDADTLLVATQRNGLFLLHDSTLTPKITAADALLPNDRITCLRQIEPQSWIIGTSTNGCCLLTDHGARAERLSRTEGLQNNNILQTFISRDGNLWIGEANGIDRVDRNTAIRQIVPDRNNRQAGYAIRVFDGQLFIGTSAGLYHAPLDPSEKDLSANRTPFTEVPGTKGQVWGLSEVNHRLFAGHLEGALLIDKNRAVSLAGGQGYWLYAPLSSFFPSRQIIAGTYTGLELLTDEGETIRDAGKVTGLFESLRFLVAEDDLIWTSHPYRGVFKAQLSADRRSIVSSRLYTEKDGLPSTLNNYVYSVKNRVAIATEKGIYEYDAATDRFRPSSFFQPFFHDRPVRYLTEDDQGNIWFISNHQVGVLDFQRPAAETAYSVILFPELDGSAVKGYESIYPYNRQNIFIGSNTGVLHLDYSRYTRKIPAPTVLLSMVKATGDGDSLLFGGYLPGNARLTKTDPAARVVLPNSWSSFHFEYASPQINGQGARPAFSYRLEGFDKDWSDWSEKTEKDYTNLPYGNYTFRVKVRNNAGNVSMPAGYGFVIRPAWYQTNGARVCYGLLIAACFYLLRSRREKKFARQRSQYKEEQERLRYLQQLELDRNEKEIIALQNDKMATTINFKNKELAMATMHLVERGKILAKIREELVQRLKNIQAPAVSEEFKPILRMLDEVEKSDADWDRFSNHFDEVHNNFLSTLKKKFPVLSATDLKLCAYLRMNLSSKEIAQLMNISVKGVEVSRYRLRKKLALPTEVNLFDFLIKETA
ncbi:MAG: triple tyrosine motif-containing protein [Puia sp.]|nr:triple tyrosine motif-containing protein [Puia sp.]